MPKSANDQTLYEVSIEGVPMVLDEMGLANEVVAQWLLGESQEALIIASPEQVAKLGELLHVQTVEPVTNGIYTDRSGKWYAVKNSTVIQSGSWMVPQDVLQSVSAGESEALTSTDSGETANVAEPAPARETDPVCGTVMRPGMEAANVNYQGHTYHFCSDECRKLFLSSPADFVKQTVATA